MMQDLWHPFGPRTAGFQFLPKRIVFLWIFSLLVPLGSIWLLFPVEPMGSIWLIFSRARWVQIWLLPVGSVGFFLLNFPVWPVGTNVTSNGKNWNPAPVPPIFLKVCWSFLLCFCRYGWGLAVIFAPQAALRQEIRKFGRDMLWGEWR